jgi:hypothetical protein
MMKSTAILFALAALSLPCHARQTYRWKVETTAPKPADHTAYRGETIVWEPTLLLYGAAIPLTNSEPATLYWQTNGMDSAWWSAPAEVLDGADGKLRAVWSPTNDVGAASYAWFVGVAATNGVSYRANGTLKMQGAPGHVPNALPLPRQSLDFASVDLANEPWPAQIAAATAGLATTGQVAAAQATADAAPDLGRWRYGIPVAGTAARRSATRSPRRRPRELSGGSPAASRSGIRPCPRPTNTTRATMQPLLAGSFSTSNQPVQCTALRAATDGVVRRSIYFLDNEV